MDKKELQKKYSRTNNCGKNPFTTDIFLDDNIYTDAERRELLDRYINTDPINILARWFNLKQK